MHYKELREFYSVNGHLKVSRKKCRNLGCWMDYQRALRREGKLSIDRLELLDQLEFHWEGRRAKRGLKKKQRSQSRCSVVIDDRDSSTLNREETSCTVIVDAQEVDGYQASSSSALDLLCRVAALQDTMIERNDNDDNVNDQVDDSTYILPPLYPSELDCSAAHCYNQKMKSSSASSVSVSQHNRCQDIMAHIILPKYNNMGCQGLSYILHTNTVYYDPPSTVACVKSTRNTNTNTEREMVSEKSEHLFAHAREGL